MNHTVSLEGDTVAFIESPNFPKFMTDDERNECYFNFTKNLTLGEIHTRFILIPTNVICADPDYDDCPQDFIVYENKSSIYFDLRKHNYYNTTLGYSAFQGFVIFDDWGGDGSCPLESVSREAPFQFTDETQIIKLKSNYFKFQNRTHPCLWQFLAPDGFGFKISITNLDISNSTKFIVENSTVIITNQNLIRQNFPYYNNDNFLKISLSGSDYNNPERKMEFEAFISIIKNNFFEVEDNCYTQTSDEKTLWTNIDENAIGYPNNAYCNYELIIQPNTEVLVYVLYLIIEGYADHLYYYPEGNESRPVDYNLESKWNIVFYTDDNETERHVPWKFTSDGNWPSHGFTIVFSPFVCTCGYPIMSVSCFGESKYKLMPTGDDNFYCGNLECNFAITVDSFCTISHIKMRLEISSNQDNADNTDEEIFDIFKFISDDIIQLEINHTNRYFGSWTLYMSTKTNNLFYARTVPSVFPRHFQLIFSTFNVPTNIPTIELTEINPYCSYYLCPKDTPVFFEMKLSSELIAKNATIDIHSATENIQKVLAFYDNKNLTYRVNFENCFLADSPYEVICKTQSNQFVVTQFNFPYDDEDDELDSCSVILFQSSTVYSENCTFETNVYNVTLHQELSVTALSKQNKTCTIFFLITPNEYNYYFKKIWMSPQANKSLEIYVGTESKLLAVIDPKTASTWQNILLNALIYAIKIPPNSAVMIDIERYNYYLNISSFPYQSVLTSQRYGISNLLLGGMDANALASVVAYNISNFEAAFTVEIFNVSSLIFCYFDSNGTKTNFNASLEPFVFANTEIGIFCECLDDDDGCTNPFEFYISIKTLGNDETTSTTKLLNHWQTTTPKKAAYINGTIKSINICNTVIFILLCHCIASLSLFICIKV